MSPFTFVADHLVRVRAAENGVFLAYANAVGEENGLDYVGGRSAIIGPDGEDLARAGDAPVLLHARLERAALQEARAALPYLAERRPELYAPKASQGSEGEPVQCGGSRDAEAGRVRDRTDADAGAGTARKLPSGRRTW